MDNFQKKQDHLQYPSDEYLFTPRNSSLLEKSGKTDQDEGLFTEKVRRTNDHKYNIITPNQSTIKRIQRTKDNNFMKNIKNNLISLKTEVNKLINNNNEQKLYEQSPHLKNAKRSNSETYSEISLQSHQTQSLWKRIMKNQAQQIDISTPSAITERRLRFFEQENELLKMKIKKMKNKHREYKMQAENGIRILENKLQQAEEVIAGHEQEMVMYKREVEQQMIGIKKMLQANTEVMKKKNSQVSIQQNIQYKKLLEKNIILKQRLLDAEANISQQQQVSQNILKQNQRLKLQIDHLNHHIEAMINNNQNNSLFRSGESKINLDYSQSRISKEKGEKDDEKSLMFDLSDCLERKESMDLRSVASMNENNKQENFKKLYEGALAENEDLYKEIRVLTQDVEGKNGVICVLNKQNQILSNRITLLENQIEQLKQKINSEKLSTVTHQKNEYIKELEQKLQNMELNLKNSEVIFNSKLQTQAPSSHITNISESIKQKDMEIKYLRQELHEKNQQVDNLRDSLGTLHKQFRDSRGEIDVRTSKFAQEIKHLREELETTRSTLKSEILLLQQINDDLTQKNKAGELRREGSRNGNQYQFEFDGNRFVKK